MTLKHLLAAAAATALMTGAAQAQTMSPPADTQTPMTQPMMTPSGEPVTTETTTSADGSTSTSVTTPMATTGAVTDTSATLTTTTVTNGPVADTPENRALYKPLSNAGRRSAPKGN
ncbi:hypothetical protein [Phenylobacterium sp.]|uniref:hypothetical protein n=1 Tax=Phenylobacterium sp. TaxID=1871053 RepID=UPI0027217012|nr:hypothetical protein [Phenylobacterium sp.]MDO8379785.1 hypothetical protein [Phenylobacterium sp.]